MELTQEQLAAVSGVSRGMLIALEKGKAWPQWKNLEAIAKVLKVTPDDFFRLEAEELPKAPPVIPDDLRIELLQVAREVGIETGRSIAREAAQETLRALGLAQTKEERIIQLLKETKALAESQGARAPKGSSVRDRSTGRARKTGAK